MMVKKLGKWLSIPLFAMLAINVNQYNNYIFYGIIGGLGIIGLYLMFNPTWRGDPTSSEKKIFKDELLNKFNSYKNDLEFRRFSLLKNFKDQNLLLSSLGAFVLIFITFCIVLFTSVESRWISFISISILISLFMMTEGDELKLFPWSRYNRMKLIYFCFILKNENKFQELISKNELIKSDIGILKKETSIDFTQIINNINIDRSKNSTYVSNDNRVLQNNFITPIETTQKETRQLDIDSSFWNFFMDINDDVNDKLETLFKIIDNINSNYVIKNNKYLIVYDKNLKKIVFPTNPAVKLAHFVKFLIYLGILKKSIAEDKNQKCLKSIFECSNEELYSYFKPSQWSRLDNIKNHFKSYYKQNDT